MSQISVTASSLKIDKAHDLDLDLYTGVSIGHTYNFSYALQEVMEFISMYNDLSSLPAKYFGRLEYPITNFSLIGWGMLRISYSPSLIAGEPSRGIFNKNVKLEWANGNTSMYLKYAGT